ncbi:MAG: transporter suffix domain-containing protein [Bacteroidetes bacterium]|nr:transporter suffix domain-containing protein [Bacteroidota bacterium]
MKNTNWKVKLGIILMIVSIPLFLAVFLIPFLSIDGKLKITLTTILLIVAEVIFWGGGLLVGKELFTKYKAHMNPKNWFKKKSPTDEQKELP